MTDELLRNGAPVELVETLLAELAKANQDYLKTNNDFLELSKAFAKLTKTAQDLQQHNAMLQAKLEEAYQAANPLTLAERGKHKALQTMYDAALEEIKRLKN